MNHASQLRYFEPGEVLLRGPNTPALLLVRTGTVAAIVNGQWGTQVVAERLHPSSFFSREDSLVLKRSLAGLRAESNVEALVLDNLPESVDLGNALAAVARERVAMYARAARQRGERSLLNGH